MYAFTVLHAQRIVEYIRNVLWDMLVRSRYALCKSGPLKVFVVVKCVILSNQSGECSWVALWLGEFVGMSSIIDLG